MTTSSTASVYTYEFTILKTALDQNGHVNNVQYVHWMQEAAVQHYEAIGGIPPTLALGATWVVRSHKIEYLRPAFAGEIIEARTWVVNIRHVRSLRRYEFVRKPGNETLVRGETDWVFVDAESGRPLAIPAKIAILFTLLPDGDKKGIIPGT